MCNVTSSMCFLVGKMSVDRFCQGFDPSKILVYTCLYVFAIFLALRKDGTITWTYWAVFAPIWFWKLMVVLGATVGSIVWWRHPHYRIEGDAYTQYKAMMITLALHLLLLMFELLVCDNMESHRNYWILVFIPLILISIVCIAISIWSVKNERSYDLELFCSVNILQFIFLALRLDQFIIWEWEIVFVPLWILLCVSLVGVLYCIIFAIILLRAPINDRHRRNSFNSALSYTVLMVPILVFQVLLTNKLDGDIDIHYITVVSPLTISYIELIFMSFGNKRTNKWWFGLRKNFCQMLMDSFPCFKPYFNISYSVYEDDTPITVEGNESSEVSSQKGRGSSGNMVWKLHTKPIVPIVSIEMPD